MRIFTGVDGRARIEWRAVPGDGHITRTLEGPRGFMHPPVPDSFDIATWPLASERD